MDDIGNIKEAMGSKRAPKKTAEKKPETASVVEPAVMPEELPAEEVAEEVDQTVADIANDTTPVEAVQHTEALDEQPSFPGCDTCRNFGSYPAWNPCSNCRHNPKNQHSYYQR